MDITSLAQGLGIAFLVLVLVAIIMIAVRRSMLARAGAIDVCWRRSRSTDGEGWVLGQGRFRDNTFQLYRSFSPWPGTARTLHRNSLKLGDRRARVGTEPDLLPVDAVIVRCTDGGTHFELALGEQALTGLRSWLESLPPATRSVKLFRRGVKKT